VISEIECEFWAEEAEAQAYSDLCYAESESFWWAIHCADQICDCKTDHPDESHHEYLGRLGTHCMWCAGITEWLTGVRTIGVDGLAHCS
jgi:hypothetical protein